MKDKYKVKYEKLVVENALLDEHKKRLRNHLEQERNVSKVLAWGMLFFFIVGVILGLVTENTHFFSNSRDYGANEAISTNALNAACERIAGPGYIFKDSDFLTDRKITCVINETEEEGWIKVVPSEEGKLIQIKNEDFKRCCYPSECGWAKDINPKDCDCIYPVACW